MQNEISNEDLRALDGVLAKLFLSAAARLQAITDAGNRDPQVLVMVDAAVNAVSCQRSKLDSLLQDRVGQSLRAVAEGAKTQLPRDYVALILVADKATQDVINQGRSLGRTEASTKSNQDILTPEAILDHTGLKGIPAPEEILTKLAVIRFYMSDLKADHDTLLAGSPTASEAKSSNEFQTGAAELLEKMTAVHEDLATTINSIKHDAGVRSVDWKTGLLRADTNQQLSFIYRSQPNVVREIEALRREFHGFRTKVEMALAPLLADWALVGCWSELS
jgi:hypothetical protein